MYFLILSQINCDASIWFLRMFEITSDLKSIFLWWETISDFKALYLVRYNFLCYFIFIYKVLFYGPESLIKAKKKFLELNVRTLIEEKPQPVPTLESLILCGNQSKKEESIGCLWHKSKALTIQNCQHYTGFYL